MRFLAASVLLIALPALAEVHSYDIKGMTCQGCVDMITSEVCKLPGVTSCKVEIGKVTLEGAKLDDAAVKAAVDKAGYQVAGVSDGGAAHASDGATANKKAKKK